MQSFDSIPVAIATPFKLQRTVAEPKGILVLLLNDASIREIFLGISKTLLVTSFLTFQVRSYDISISYGEIAGPWSLGVGNWNHVL